MGKLKFEFGKVFENLIGEQQHDGRSHMKNPKFIAFLNRDGGLKNPLAHRWKARVVRAKLRPKAQADLPHIGRPHKHHADESERGVDFDEHALIDREQVFNLRRRPGIDRPKMSRQVAHAANGSGHRRVHAVIVRRAKIKRRERAALIRFGRVRRPDKILQRVVTTLGLNDFAVLDPVRFGNHAVGGMENRGVPQGTRVRFQTAHEKITDTGIGRDRAFGLVDVDPVGTRKLRDRETGKPPGEAQVNEPSDKATEQIFRDQIEEFHDRHLVVFGDLCQTRPMRIIQDLEVGLDEDLAEKIAWMEPGHNGYRVLRQSVDARRRHHVHFVYSVEVAGPGETLPVFRFDVPRVSPPPSPHERPVVIGSGPAGLFAALRLVERGIPCRLFERGSESGQRIKGINRYWRYGELDPRNNVCYGEGGAGLYSDGKLITRIKSPHIPYVLERLVRFGAPAEIQYLANPHVGSDKIRRVIPKIREFLRAQGCEIHYDTKIEKIQTQNDAVTGVVTETGDHFATSHVVLATGHSAEDMLRHLREIGVFMEPKPFALGLRIEHPQPMINRLQYRDAATHPKLGSANYRLADHDPKTGIGVYSFCMCPGGFVLSSGTEADGIVVNGMSNFHRNSPFANAAIVVSVDQRHFGEDLFDGLEFRRNLERAAYRASRTLATGRELPAQRVTNFLGESAGDVRPGSSPSGAVAVRLDQLLPKALRQRLGEGLQKFEKQLPGFVSNEGQLYGVESRTSCPVRVTRDAATLQSVSHRGLYPCGEGAGYAGGITSAACDGIRVAEKIVEDLLMATPPPVADEVHLQDLKAARRESV